MTLVGKDDEFLVVGVVRSILVTLFVMNVGEKCHDNYTSVSKFLNHSEYVHIDFFPRDHQKRKQKTWTRPQHPPGICQIANLCTTSTHPPRQISHGEGRNFDVAFHLRCEFGQVLGIWCAIASWIFRFIDGCGVTHGVSGMGCFFWFIQHVELGGNCWVMCWYDMCKKKCLDVV